MTIEENPKSEIRNPNQEQPTSPKRKRGDSSSDFGFRISDF